MIVILGLFPSTLQATAEVCVYITIIKYYKSAYILNITYVLRQALNIRQIEKEGGREGKEKFYSQISVFQMQFVLKVIY